MKTLIFLKIPHTGSKHMKRILLIKTDGDIHLLPALPSYQELRIYVGGMVEHVRVLDRIEAGRFIYSSMYINEEGLLDDLPRNEKATEIYQRNIRAQFPDDPQPFRRANEEMKKQYEGFVIFDELPDNVDESYHDNPWIVGDVVFFEGYTSEEVENMFIAADKKRQDDDDLARALYEQETSNHPTIHCNRFPTWDEISADQKARIYKSLKGKSK